MGNLLLPNAGVGLARVEFIISNVIGIHPKAILDVERLPASWRDEIKRCAMKRVREEMGLTNVQLMVPFVRTVGEGQAVVDLLVDELPIKFEIVLEARIQLEAAALADQVCGVSTLTSLDMATSKLLANSDRWRDDGVFSRDVIDLAMLNPSLSLLRKAVQKAQGAYGEAITRDLERAIDLLQNRTDWLERCMQAMAMTLPKAVVWKKIRALRRVLA